MVAIAQNEGNMAAIRKNGWMFDPSEFTPDHRYPVLQSGEYGPTNEVLALADSPSKLFLFLMLKTF
ncbi:hypothetical protein F444_03161 [Phytophthora nicotianae P1976]|uniref:Uncharacterized protein n=1 Tax=Phytophthora nicotianae P1976 TaxID=1317066 RepID=A0A081AV19_PHYNI|nr:hypothetical protein F444_03161 [Phytophthora nicotianae P1976]